MMAGPHHSGSNQAPAKGSAMAGVLRPQRGLGQSEPATNLQLEHLIARSEDALRQKEGADSERCVAAASAAEDPALELLPSPLRHAARRTFEGTSAACATEAQGPSAAPPLRPEPRSPRRVRGRSCALVEPPKEAEQRSGSDSEASGPRPGGRSDMCVSASVTLAAAAPQPRCMP
jgi:hypothetical protein